MLTWRVSERSEFSNVHRSSSGGSAFSGNRFRIRRRRSVLRQNRRKVDGRHNVGDGDDVEEEAEGTSDSKSDDEFRHIFHHLHSFSGQFVFVHLG